MRRAALLVTALVLLPVLAGCVSPGALQSAGTAGVALDAVVVPEGAAVEAVEGGVRLSFLDVALPFEQDVVIPEGATLVRATAEAGDASVVRVLMREAESMRRRCQTPVVEAWNVGRAEASTCIGLTAVDPPGATWKVQVAGSAPGGGLLAEAPTPTASLVAVEFLAAPLEGPVARLDLSQLSMPRFQMLGTETFRIESHDRTLLHVEVTRPDTDEPVPAVIVSSPYNHAIRAAGGRPSDDLVKDWGSRGYAIVVADVRGYGESGGCVEVWSENEQLDQVALVEWAAVQPWSNGKVGFYGQSYVGTTPVEAAVNAPRPLKAIVAVAPVINAYDDWHFGGVPNGEDLLSPVAYQTLGTDAMLVPGDPVTSATNVANGACDPTLAARANDPRAVYDAFYEERNFSARAQDVTAAVLYTQGFEDRNVKSAMITHWFNALESPKLGLFGHWVHQHPPRADQEVLFLAWMDQHVKGKPLGFENVPPVSVVTNAGTHREASAWPPLDAAETRLWPDFGKGELGAEPADGFALLTFDSLGAGAPLALATPTLLALEGALEAPVHLAGSPRVDVDAHVEWGENGYVFASLYDDDVLVSWGMFNLAHRFGHDQHRSLAPMETIRFSVPLLPTEHVFDAGSEVRLELRGAQVTDWSLVKPGQPTQIGLHGGETGTALVLPTVPADSAQPVPAILDWR